MYNIARPEHSQWLVLSSCSFILPAIYAIYYHLYFLSCVLIITTLVSAAFWINAIYSWRRTLDLIISKMGGEAPPHIHFLGTIYNCRVFRCDYFMCLLLFIQYIFLLYKTKFVLDKLSYCVSFIDDDGNVYNN